MAKPFFSGNYGSALAKVDTRPITEAGRAQGQMYANMGSQIGGLIKEYGLNKEKRAELTGEIEAMLPQYMDSLTGTGNEVEDKKNFQRLEKFKKGDSSMADLKGLAGELAMKDKVEVRNFARETSEVNKKLLEQKFQTNETANKIATDNKRMKDQAFTGLLARADEIKSSVDSGDVQYDDLFATSKRLYNDYDLIKNQQADPFEYAYSTDAESQAELDKLEAKKTKLDIKGKELELTEKTEEAAKMPEFNDRDSAVESVKDLPQGVSASFKKFKDGFDVELQYKAKEFTDIPSVPGFPNYKIVGGYVYEADPKTKKLTKLGSENFGEKSELLQKTIESLTTKEVEQYALAKFRAKEQNDDGDYMVEVDGETITIPFNQGLENRLIYLDGLQNKLKTQIDYDLTTQ